MSRTVQRCGPLAVAVYTDDGLGRRLSIGSITRSFTVAAPIARSKEELREVIAVLRQLGEELPEHEPIALGGGS